MFGDHREAEALSPEELRRLVPDIAQRDVYVCGPPAMTDAIRVTLAARRVAAPHLHGAVRVLMRRAAAVLLVTAIAVVLLAAYDTKPPMTFNPNSALRRPRSAQRDADAAAAPARDDDGEGPAAGDAVLGIQVQAWVHRGRLVDVKTLSLTGADVHTNALNARAEPILRREALQAGSADIDTVTGATGTSESWIHSLMGRSRRRVATELVMGMPVTVRLRGGGAERRVFGGCGGSTRRSAPIARTPRSAASTAASCASRMRTRDVQEVLARCERLREQTGGYFDARAGGSLDPSGLVKGWAVDRAAALLRGRFMIDAGGDVLLRGGPWRVGVRHPLRGDALCAASSSATPRSRPRAHTSAATTCSTRWAAGRRAGRCRSRSWRLAGARRRLRDRRVRHGPAGPGVDGAAARVRGDDGARGERCSARKASRAPARLVGCGMMARP